MITDSDSGLAVRIARVRFGWTQGDLAQKTHINVSDMSRIERGWIPPLKVQERIAKSLGVARSALFDPAHEEPQP